MPRPRLKRLTLGLLLGACAVWWLRTLPPGTHRVDDSTWRPTFSGAVIGGAVHVHTDRSDGGGRLHEVAAAAARADLQFVILGDHGNGTRPPEPPAYHSGVLVLDGVEISTTGGHYLAVGMAAAPYPLAGEPRDVVDDVRRLGGFGVVAHPSSPKRALQWTDWSVPVDGIEWLNADAEWRDERWPTLVRAPLDYLVRPAATLASLLDRPEAALARWDAIAAGRIVVGLAAVDAHGQIDVGGDAYTATTRNLLRVPSYEASFRAFSIRLELEAPLSGDATADGRAVLAALRAGRVFSALDAIAAPSRFEFSAASGQLTARMGETLMPSGKTMVHARAALPPGGEIVLIQDGREVRTTSDRELAFETDVAFGLFRAEVRLRSAPGSPPVPWIVGNPIYIGPRAPAEPAAARPEARRLLLLFGDQPDPDGWRIEKDEESRAAVSSTPTVSGRELAFRYALRGAPAGGQYAALVHGIPGGEEGKGPVTPDRLLFRARANRAMRLEVQIRQPDGPDGKRWQRSIYLDGQPREVVVFIDDMMPIGHADPRRPDPASLDSILFVVDTNHTPPATAGIVWLDEVRLAGR